MGIKRRPGPRPWLLALVAAAAIVAGCGASSATVSPGLSNLSSAAASPSSAATASPTVPPPPVTPSPTSAPTVALVPVAGFRTSETSVDAVEVAATLAGTSKRFGSLELVAGDSSGILEALGLQGSASAGRVVFAASADALATDLDVKPSRLGFVRASQVGPSIRALAWGGVSLFGSARVASPAAWPLKAALGMAADTFDPSRTWTIAAAGDVMLDRGVYDAVKNQGKGVDYPFAGSTVTITSRFCCSTFNWKLPRTRVVDTARAVRALMADANLSMVNLEGPVPAKSVFHPHGMTFSFDKALLAGLRDAGIDVVSLANNHIGNAGRQGMRDTIAALDGIGIAHGGLGTGRDAAAAPVVFTIDGVKVAFLAYDSLAMAYGAGPSLIGSAEIGWGTYPADIRAARAAGAQVVIVYPHWGVEYRSTPTVAERHWAHLMVDAGADLVIGNHAHWAAAMEVYKGKPIWYSLGNFVFDQSWSEPTEEGLILELTFSGTSLVQVWMHPTLILDNCQPNLLDAAGGKVVMDRVFGASQGLLPW